MLLFLATPCIVVTVQPCMECPIKKIYKSLVDVVRLSSEVTKSSTVILLSSWSWVRRLLNSSSISLSLAMLLTDSCPNPYFSKQLVIVSVDKSFQACCNKWIAFAMLTSCIISEAFLPSSIHENTYISSLFL